MQSQASLASCSQPNWCHDLVIAYLTLLHSPNIYATWLKYDVKNLNYTAKVWSLSHQQDKMYPPHGSPQPSPPLSFGGAFLLEWSKSPVDGVPSLSVLLQMFSDYQMQQMSEHFIDSFGFGDNEFDDNEDGR